MVPTPTAIRWRQGSTGAGHPTSHRFLREEDEEGWRLNYTVDMWASGKELDRK